MGHVQPGHDVEEAWVDAVVDAEGEPRVVVSLKREERQAEQDGGEEPPGELAPVAPPGRLHPGLEHHAAGHQQDGERDRDGEVRDGDRERRPHRGLGVDGEVRPEERGEEHRLRGHEERHPEDRARRAAGLSLVYVRLGHAHTGSPPCPWAARRRSRTGRSDRIGGRRSKLWSGGGDDVAHSSVFPPHGSSGAERGFRSVVITFTRKMSMAIKMM